MQTISPRSDQSSPYHFDFRRSVDSGNPKERSRVTLVAIFLCLVAICSIYAAWYQSGAIMQASQQMAGARLFQKRLDLTMRDIVAADGAQRIFVITGDSRSLAQYTAVMKKVENDIEDLRLDPDAKPFHQHTALLEQLLRARLNALQETVALRQESGFSAAWREVISRESQTMMDQLATQSRQLETLANERLAEESAQVQRTNKGVATLLPASLSALALLSLLLGYFTFKYYSEKRYTEISLAHAYHLFESFMDNTPAIAYIKDKNSRYIYTNSNMNNRLHELNVDNLVGLSDLDWMPAEVAQRTRERDEYVLESGEQIHFTQKLEDNQVWFVIKFPLRDPAGNRLVGGVGIDITELKRAEREIEKLNNALQRRVSQLERLTIHLASARDEADAANRLKTQFMANLSHEIRTPMSGLLGMSELLLDVPLDDDTREVVQFIHVSAQNLLTVVNDLLDFAKLESGTTAIEIEEFTVDNLINTVLRSVDRDASKKGISLQAQVDADMPQLLYGDPGRIRQVLLNLVHNAVKFTPQGTISVTAERKSLFKDSILLKFTVTDSGIGLSEGEQKRLFEPFYQADYSNTRRYGGTGLGLSISKGLVNLMKGKIGLKSKPNEGSSFWFEVPVYLERPDPDATA